MKRKTVFGTSVLVFMLFSMVVTTALAQPRIVGVNVGDWFKYGDISGSWFSDDPNATFPQLELNYTEWYQISVVGVSGTNITFQGTWHFTNGSERIESGHIDIDTGEGNMTFSAISSNLNTSDTIYSSPGYSTMKINETVFRTYPDTPRETNHLNITMEVDMPGFYYYMSMNWYWDRVSGVFVEMTQDFSSQTGGYTTTWSLLMRITESNVWVVPEFPSWLSITLILTILTATIAIYKRRLLKTPTPTH